MLALFTAFAAEETSKTAFYICGGLLTLWALVVSAVGIRMHDRFPTSRGAARGAMAISVLLIVAAMATAVITA